MSIFSVFVITAHLFVTVVLSFLLLLSLPVIDTIS